MTDVYDAAENNATDSVAANSLAASAAMQADTYKPDNINLFKTYDFHNQIQDNFTIIDNDADGSLSVTELREFANQGDTYASRAAARLADNYDTLAAFSVNGNSQFDRHDLACVAFSARPIPPTPVQTWLGFARELLDSWTNPGDSQVEPKDNTYEGNLKNHHSLYQIPYFRRDAQQMESDPASQSQDLIGVNTAQFFDRNLSRIDVSPDRSISKLELMDALQSEDFSAEEKIVMKELLNDWNDVEKIKNGKAGIQSEDAHEITNMTNRYVEKRHLASSSAAYALEHFDSWDSNQDGELTWGDLTSAKNNSTDQSEIAVLDYLLNARNTYGDVVDSEKYSYLAPATNGKFSYTIPRTGTRPVYGYTRTTLEQLPERAVRNDKQFQQFDGFLRPAE